jgi:hypothetical protein
MLEPVRFIGFPLGLAPFCFTGPLCLKWSTMDKGGSVIMLWRILALRGNRHWRWNQLRHAVARTLHWFSIGPGPFLFYWTSVFKMKHSGWIGFTKYQKPITNRGGTNHDMLELVRFIGFPLGLAPFCFTGPPCLKWSTVDKGGSIIMLWRILALRGNRQLRWNQSQHVGASTLHWFSIGLFVLLDLCV